MTPTIRPAVRAVFRAYSERLEGRTRHLYADVKGLVTVSVGCLVDPIQLALRLDWRIGDRAATQVEIRDDWQTVKALGANNRTAESQAELTSIRLTDSGVDSLLWSRLNANAEWLRKNRFLNFHEYSADAQLGILSTAWAIGCDFLNTKPSRPDLVKAIMAGDWLAANSHAKLVEAGNKGVVDRNRQQERCFSNAAVVAEHNLDPAILNWPASVIPPVTV